MSSKRNLQRDVRRLEDESRRMRGALARALNERDNAVIGWEAAQSQLSDALDDLRVANVALRGVSDAAARAMPGSAA